MATAAARRWRTLTVAGVSAAALGVTSVVAGAPGGAPPARADGLERFSGCGPLTSYLREAAASRVTAYGLDGGAGVTTGAGVPDLAVRGQGEASAGSASGDDAAASAPTTGEEATGAAVGSGATGTNVQEAGVDEPDLAKTDGRHVYTVTGGVLRVVDTTGGTPTTTGTLPLPEGRVRELLLVGDRALLLGSGPAPNGLGSGSAHGSPAPPSGGDAVPLPRPTTTTRATLVDLADPGAPRLLGSADLGGTYVTARAHDGLVRLVVSSQPDLALRQPTTREGVKEAHAHNRRVVAEATAADWLPHAVVRDASGREVRDGLLVDCAAVHHPAEPAGLGTVSVVTVDPAAGLTALPATAVTTSSDHVYASPDRLYVATGSWQRQPLSGGDVATDRATTLTRPVTGRTTTELHAFDLTDDGAPPYVASGSVDGWLLGRWAMSEHEGRLRVATTRDGGDRTADGSSGEESGDGASGSEAARPWVPDNQVVVLDERGDRLVEVGQVGGLGEGETIRSVRWFGDLATVVTFRQTDPLYTVDLSDPRDPRVLGELKVRGFSAYLHPVGDGLLLGVGQDATAQGVLTGLQVSSFDLSDLTDPRRVDALGLDGGWSPVMDDSRAFTYVPGRRLALVPVDAWGVAVPEPRPGTGTPGLAEPAEPGTGGDPVEPGTTPEPAEPGVAPDVAPTPAGGGVVAVRVGEHGALTSPARLAEGAQVQRALPVGDRLALVGPTALVLVDAGTLTETGRLPLA